MLMKILIQLICESIVEKLLAQISHLNKRLNGNLLAMARQQTK